MSTQRRRILFVLSGLRVGGAERLLVSLVNRFDRNQFLLNVISLSNENPLAREIQSEDVRFTPLTRKWRYDMRPALQIRQIIIENQVDSVIGLDLFCFFYIWYALLGIHPKPKVFICIHTTNKPTDLKHSLLKTIYLRLLSGDERFISVCDAQAAYWSRAYGISRRRFTTIHNGVDVEYFHPSDNSDQRNSVRSSLMIPRDAFVILQVASITPTKRHEDSLLALRYLMDCHPSLPGYLVLVGQGPEDRERMLRRWAASLAISDRVKFCGLQADVRPYYEAADVFTLSSQSEAFSMAALEAMSMGLPCILTEVGGAREMIVEGMNGYLVPPRCPRDLAKAWLKALDNKDLLDREKIRAWVVENFDLKGCARKYQMLLK